MQIPFCKVKSSWPWFSRLAIVVALLFCHSSTFAQTPDITISNGIAALAWPLTSYYYLLQTTTNLSASNSWVNVATASPLSSIYSSIIPPQTPTPVITNVISDNFVITQPNTNIQQFFRLKAPSIIPVFGFAIFYDGLLEFSDSATIVVNGGIHANGPIYLGSANVQTFNNPLTTANTISSPVNAGLTYISWVNTTSVVLKGQPPYVTNTPAFISPLGTNNPHVMIEIPPFTELPTSAIGQARLYNQANIILIVTNSFPDGVTNPTVRLTFQNWYDGNIPATDPTKIIYNYTNVTTTFLRTNPSSIGPSGIGSISMPFLTLTNTFFDQRESKTNLVTQIDVGAFAGWIATNVCCTNKFNSNFGLYPKIFYVADQRTGGSKNLAVVRLINGQQLPYNDSLGFSMATQNPLYIQGNYNTTVDGIHFAFASNSTTNTFLTNGIARTYAVPAALTADAITVLSSNWQDRLSSKPYTSMATPTSMTLNAAIIAGNVPSTGTSAATFSGGVQNLTRLLEPWNSATQTLIYNTSLVCLYSSKMATNQFQLPGIYYTPPTRDWGFDPNFYNPGRLPPGTPGYVLP